MMTSGATAVSSGVLFGIPTNSTNLPGAGIRTIHQEESQAQEDEDGPGVVATHEPTCQGSALRRLVGYLVPGLCVGHLFLRRVQDPGQLLDVAGFLQELEGFEASSSLGRFEASVASEHDGLQGRVEGPHLL